MLIVFVGLGASACLGAAADSPDVARALGYGATLHSLLIGRMGASRRGLPYPVTTHCVSCFETVSLRDFRVAKVAQIVG